MIPLPFVWIVVVGIGVFALVGWLLDSAVLKSIVPGLTPMNPMTAISFILAAIALGLLRTHERDRLARFLSLTVVVISLIIMVDLAFGWEIGIDRILFTNELLAYPVPNRMAPNAAANFFLVGAAIFLTSRRSIRWTWLPQVLTLVAALVAFLAVIGYIYGTGLFYSISVYVPMALNTAITFLVLSVGILSVQLDVGVMALWRSRTTGGVLVRRLTSASALILLIMGWMRQLGVSAGVFDAQLGETLFALLSSFLLLGVIWWTARVVDRADREGRRSEAALGASEARYRALFEYSGDAIILLDEAGNFVNANTRAEMMTGYSHEELLQRSVGALSQGDLVQQSALLFEEVKTKGSWSGELGLIRKDGSSFTGEISVAEIESGLYQGIIHDITERIKVEENLRRTLEEEQHLNELKSSFVSMVSHEFRTPLAVIRSSTDLLLHYGERTTSDKRQERLEKIQREIDLMVEMLDDILIIRRSEDVGVAFDPKPLDLGEFCTRLIAEIQPATPSHQIDFSSSGDCTHISADPKLLRQLITNLISNAAKYSPERKHVQLELICGEKEILLHVRDDGIGIPEEDQERLFEVFHRASNVGSISGTGLGLPIIKLAVEAHGGTVAFASEVDVGTTFTISLPRIASR